MTEENVLKNFIEKENKSSLYSYEIDGIFLYPLIRRDIRVSYLRKKGFNQMDTELGINYKAAILTTLISFTQFLRLFIFRKKAKKIIHSFPRVERIGDYYIDKFTEPVYKLTRLADNAIIFSKSFGGVRREPRFMSKRFIYTDIVDFFMRIGRMWRLIILSKEDAYILENLSKEIRDISNNEICLNKHIRNSLFQRLYGVKLFYIIYRYFGVKKVYLLPRNPVYVCAAHRAGAEVYEFQHGITYGVTKLYSGKCIPEYTPDYFLAFSKTEPSNVYGIEKEKIITIGWAFSEYIKKEKPLLDITDKDVLVICDPEITDILINIIIPFAKNRTDIQFHFRPHPNQKMTTEQLDRINRYSNLHLQDNKINSNIVLNCFTHIIGENSTVLYEAVSMGKKVGKLFYPELNPKYLQETDKNFFYEISSISEFNSFVNAELKKDNSFSIYSPWNKNYSYIFE